MKIRVPDYYKYFKCIDTNCEDSCCAGWEVEVDEKSRDFYEKAEGEIGERLKKAMEASGGTNFELVNNRCPFLNEKNLCDLYIALGEDALCDTCTNYPRYMEEYGDLKEIGIAYSCEVAAKLMLEHKKPVTFEMEENNQPITTYNDIDYEMYEGCYRARKIAIKILQDRNLSINERISLYILFAKEIQEFIDEEKETQIPVLCDKYENQEELEKIRKGLEKYRNHPEIKQQLMQKYIGYYETFEVIHPGWTNMLEEMKKLCHEGEMSSEEYQQWYEEFENAYRDKQYEYENWMVYFVYRYFLKVVYDYNLLTKMQLGVVSFAFVKELAVVRYHLQKEDFGMEDQIEIMHRYSREIEHSDENFYALEKLFEKEEFSAENLLYLVL